MGRPIQSPRPEEGRAEWAECLAAIDRNKALVLASIDEGWNRHQLAIFDELFDPDLVDHSLPWDLPATREGMKQHAARYWTAFPDLHLTIEDQIAEGDRVVTRWTARGTHTGWLMHVPPTGKPVTMTGIRVDRVLSGRIVETWAEFDQLGVLEQLETAPALADRMTG
jgi:predicted ester cyclase